MKKVWAFVIIIGLIIAGSILWLSNPFSNNQLLEVIAFVYGYILLSMITLELSPKATYSFEVCIIAFAAVEFGFITVLFTTFFGGIINGLYKIFRGRQVFGAAMLDFFQHVFASLIAAAFTVLMKETLILSSLALTALFLLCFFCVTILLKSFCCTLPRRSGFFRCLTEWFGQSTLAVIGICLTSFFGVIIYQEGHYELLILLFLFLLYGQYIISWLSREHNSNMYLYQMFSMMLKTDLDMIRDMYVNMMPAPRQQWSNLKIAACNLPAAIMSGDFYDFIPINKELYAIVIGDVMGHGTKAAIQMNTAMVGVRALLRSTHSPAKCLTELNKVSNSFLERTQQFCTIFLGIYDSAQNVFRFASGGHPAPFMFRKRGLSDFLKVKGPAIGFLPDYEYKESCCTMEPGDFLFLYTDGLTEAIDSSGNSDSDKIRNFLLSCSSMRNIFGEVHNHIQGLSAEGHDDITFICVEVDEGVAV